MAKFSEESNANYRAARKEAVLAFGGEAWSLNDIKQEICSTVSFRLIIQWNNGCMVEPTGRFGTGQWAFYSRQDANKVALSMIEYMDFQRQRMLGKER